MALSRMVKIGDGITKQFVVNFALGYLATDDITCRVGSEVDGAGNPLYRTITFLSETLFEISGAAPGVDVRVLFERTVDKTDTLVHFSDGDVMDEVNLDLSFKQILMAVHEALDGRLEDFTVDIDVGNNRVVNLSTPIDPLDAANKAYVDANNSSSSAAVAVAAAETAVAAAGSSAGSAGNSASSASASAASAAAAQTSAIAAANSATASATSATNAATSAGTAASAVSSTIQGLPLKALPTVADRILILDNAAGNVLKLADIERIVAMASSTPVGAIIDVYGNGTSVIPGYLKVIPGLEITSAYPELRAFALANGWAVNGSGNPILPSGDGLFKRSWAAGQTRDAGRVFGSVQLDAMQGHIHGPGGTSTGYVVSGTGTFSGASGSNLSGSTNTGGPVTDGTNGTPRTAAETRVANMTVTWYIRAYSAPVDASQVASAQALNDIADARARLVLAENASFTKLFRTGPIAYANSAATTAAHGLGVIPKLISAKLVCIVTAGGYPVGHTVELSSFYGWNGALNLAATLWADATTVGLSVANGIVLSQLGGSTAQTLSPGGWTVNLEARA